MKKINAASEIETVALVVVLFFLLLFALLLPSCTIPHYERKAIRTGDRQLNEQIEAYYETIWNPENNRPGEQDSIMNLIRKIK